jgi:3'-phosphoadenosine 5'-phosphosulfate sulfotransferase (PAPS reductase)/FAD synthetase
MIEVLPNVSHKRSYANKRIEIQTLQQLPLHNKIESTNMAVREALLAHKKPVVAWSGGKDSTALLYLVLQQNPEIDVVWVNTGVEYPECTKFIRELTQEWKINLHIAKPPMTFWQATEKYGYPFWGKGNSSGYWYNRVELWNRKGRHELARIIDVAKASNECCRILKENPAKKLYKELGVDCIILGNMVSESHQRLLTWMKKGDYFYSISEKRWKLWPFFAWTDDDIWEFHKIYDIPHSPIYDKGHRRNGCWPCLMDLKYPDNHFRALRHSHPKLWKFLVNDKKIGEIILALKLGFTREEMENHSDELEKKAAILIKNQPCFFDKV